MKNACYSKRSQSSFEVGSLTPRNRVNKRDNNNNDLMQAELTEEGLQIDGEKPG